MSNRTKIKAPPLTRAALPASCCPDCGYVSDQATSISKRPIEPKPDDLSVCLNCGALLQFNDILVAKRMPRELLSDLDLKTKNTLLVTQRAVHLRGRLQPKKPTAL